MEPVEVEIAWKRRAEDEDDDVDMIPLIDVSLVLLVFFIMTTAAIGGVVSTIRTPPAEHKLLAIDKNMLWVGIDRDGEGQLVYYLGQGEQKEAKKLAYEAAKAANRCVIQPYLLARPTHLNPLT